MGITQQRLIDLYEAAQDYEQALNKYKERVEIQLSQYPDLLPLKILAAVTIMDLLEQPMKSPTKIAVEAENIRLTRAHNDQRRALAMRRLREKSPPTIPEIDDSWSEDQLSSIIQREKE